MAPPSSSNSSAFYANPRADFSAGSMKRDNGYCPSYEQTIQISRREYDDLMSISRQYVNLRQNLIRGGVDEATLDILSADDEANTESEPLQPQSGNAQRPDRHNTFGKEPSVVTQVRGSTSNGSIGHGSGYPQNHHGYGGQSHSPTASTAVNDFMSDFGLEDGEIPQGTDENHGTHESDAPSQRYVHERKCLRTLQLVGLSESTTLADVAAVVRGGQLVELYIRAHDRVGIVSFAREPDAKAFFDHVKRRDLYIKNKRVDVRWSDRQFTLLGHVSHKINGGATRNLVIRQYNPRITEASVREDLDHIYNLVVISVTFADGNCFISTNSVHNAMYARSCMMSRITSRIEWAPDECDQPLERVAPKVRQKKVPVQKKQPGFGAASRFQLLNLDDGSDDKAIENETDDDDDDDDDSLDGVHGGGRVPAVTRK
ncbi:hypothetical protein SCUCBS95973_003633 [Sporothrix curviconia]|uniref:Negative regulator of differentiation 1 n=1 Tax=Sporothrix curviconia TaxID=1260050 RepID=A0ABP0BHA1_9PEZI